MVCAPDCIHNNPLVNTVGKDTCQLFISCGRVKVRYFLIYLSSMYSWRVGIVFLIVLDEGRMTFGIIFLFFFGGVEE